MNQGPNVKKLIAHKMSLLAIPPGSGKNSLQMGVSFLSDPARIMAAAREATAFVEAAIQAVRQASEPNPWKTSTDEEIAGEILKVIEKRKLRP